MLKSHVWSVQQNVRAHWLSLEAGNTTSENWTRVLYLLALTARGTTNSRRLLPEFEPSHTKA